VDVQPARYDAAADAYVKMFGDAVDDPATSALLELLGDVRQMRLLDAPCGEGRVARELARRGADVTGVDISLALLERARDAETRGPLGVDYVHADVSSAGSLAGERFDGVVCNFGLSDIDDLEGVLQTYRRVLSANGRFVFSILHPWFPGLNDLASGGYYQEGWWRADAAGSDLRRDVGSNHRTLSTYLNALRRHCFTLDEIAEPPPPSEWPVDSVPMFFVGRGLAS
jgi:2-polyprenyl-3-methyl-5-hydroxy-6-metoxy-1,4-benzoquinol methylase